MLETAERLRVRPLLNEVAKFIAEILPAYQWPGKTAYSYNLAEQTSQGRPTQRSYATLWLDLE